MADRFDRFLASSLAPPERVADRKFVAGVQARIILEERLAAERRALLSSLAAQLIAVAAVAAALAMAVRAAPIADWFGRSPAVGLVALLVAFGFVAAMVGSSARAPAC